MYRFKVKAKSIVVSLKLRDDKTLSSLNSILENIDSLYLDDENECLRIFLESEGIHDWTIRANEQSNSTMIFIVEFKNLEDSMVFKFRYPFAILEEDA